MCRWIAYTGPDIKLASLVVEPDHSLLMQSRHATESTFEVNGDGFGIGWFAEATPIPGVYRDTRPAWNDANLRSIAEHLSSGMFLAHIRASTSGDITRSNCHPFRHRNWLFQHNGGIGDFARIRHALDADIHPDLYASKEGSTDTETMFLLALTFGLQDDPKAAIQRMIECVERARAAHDVMAPFRMTIAAADGHGLYAARYASDTQAPSLYHSVHSEALTTVTGEIDLSAHATIIVSEPLDAVQVHWAPVEAGAFIHAVQNRVESSVLV